MLMWFTLPEDDKVSKVNIGELFDQHGEFLLRHATRLLGPGDHVQDVVQDVFIIAHQKRDTLYPGPELQGWLLNVLRHVVAHEKRSRARRGRLERAVAFEEAPSTLDRQNFSKTGVKPDAPLAQRERSQEVWRILRAMPYAQAETMILFEFEGMPCTQIAELLEVPVNTLYSRLSKARKTFLKHWEHLQAPEETPTSANQKVDP